MSEYFSNTKGGRINGGSSVTGGYVATGGYDKSSLPAEKQKLIRAIANAVKDSLSVKGDISSKSPAELLSMLKKMVPARGSMSSDSVLLKNSDAQQKVCKQLAVALNKHADMTLDINDNPDALCDQVMEAMSSIFQEVRGEFITVTKDVKKSLSNIMILKNSMEQSFNSLLKTVQKSDDSGAKMQANSIKTLNSGLLNILNNQIQILSNTLNMRIDPTSATIASLSEDDSDWKSYVRKLQKDMGTKNLGHKLVYTLAGLKHAAIMASEVDAALKQIGASVKDYTSYTSLSDLELHLTELWEKNHNNPSAKDIQDLMASLEIIRYHHYNYPDIIKELKDRSSKMQTSGGKLHKKKGGVSLYGGDDIPEWASGGDTTRVAGGGESAESAMLYGGGSCGDSVMGGNMQKLGKRMKTQKTFRKMLLMKFKRQLEKYAQSLAHTIDRIGKQLGKSIPLDDSLEEFISSVKILSQDSIHKVNFYMAASGFRTDARSKEERARFLGNLKAVRRAIAPLLQNVSTKGYFTGVDKSLSDMVGFIDGFADRYLKPMSQLLTNSTPDVSFTDSRTGDDELDITGGNNHDEDAGANNDDDDGPDGGYAGTDYSYISLAKVASELVHFHGVAKMRDNLAGVAANMTAAAKDYTAISGEAVGNLIISEKKKFNTWNADMNDKDKAGTAGSLLKAWVNDLSIPAQKYKYTDAKSGTTRMSDLTLYGGGDLPAWKQGLIDNVTKFKKMEVDCRINLYRTAESIDLYMIHFANAVATNPESIRSLFDITKELDAIANWYGDRSGSQLVQVMESMPYAEGASNSVSSIPQAPRLAAQTQTTTQTTTQSPEELERRKKLDDAWMQERRKKLDDAWMPANREQAKQLSNALPTRKEILPTKTKQLDSEIRRTDSAGDIVVSQRGAIDNNVSDDDSFANQDYAADFNEEKDFNQDSNMLKAGGGSVVLTNITDRTVFINGDVDTDFKLSGDHYYDEIKKVFDDTAQKSLGNPLFSMLCGKIKKGNSSTNELEELLKKAKQAVMQVRVLDNIIKLFAQAGNKIAGKSLDSEQYMSLEMIRQNLSCYVFMSAFSMGITGSKLEHVDNWALNNHYGINMRTIADMNAKDDTVKKTFESSDALFVMIVKSMVAKVFTVISAYGVTNKPLFKYSSISNARQIMGGANGKKKKKPKKHGKGELDSLPEVIPEATELYIRLPLLAEFYRETLSFTANKKGDPVNGKDMLISMVPEMDNVWQDLIKIVFDEAKYIEEGTYSESQVRRLIRAINDIYRKYKTNGEQKTNTSAISAFVAEFNRRYGVVESKYVTEYTEERKRRYEPSTYDDDETPDYDILDKYDSGTQSRRPLPSDRYDYVGDTTIDDPKNKFDKGWNDIVRKFRNSIDRQICVHKPDSSDYSFVTTVMQQKRLVASCKDNTSRYNQVLKAIQASSHLNNVNHYKALMYHESVVSPLATLYSLYTLLNAYTVNAELLDLKKLEKEIIDHYLAGNSPVSAVNAVIPATATSRSLFYTDKGIKKGFHGADNDIDPKTAVKAYVEATDKGTRTQELSQQFLCRFLVDRDSALKKLVEVLWGIGTDLSELVTVKIESGHLLCDFSKMGEYINYTLKSVKSATEKFRNVIDRNVIRLYEGGLHHKDKDNTNPASIYWLEENLVEKLIKNRDGNGLDSANEKLSGCYASLRRKWDVVARLNGNVPVDMDQAVRLKAIGSNPDPVVVAWEEHLQSLRCHSVDDAMSSLVYWSHNSVSMKAAPLLPNDKDSFPFFALPRSIDLLDKDDVDDSGLLKALEKSTATLLLAQPADRAGAKAKNDELKEKASSQGVKIIRGRYKYYNDGKDHTWTDLEDVGLLTHLNQSLSYYLLKCVDKSDKKWYGPLVKHFGEGSHASDVMNENGIDDINVRLTTVAGTTGGLGVPVSGSVVFASLAQVIKNILVSKKSNATKDPRYRCDTLMEVPEHIKDNLRAGLPAFQKLFRAAKVKADILRKLSQNLCTARFYDSNAALATRLTPVNIPSDQCMHDASGSLFVCTSTVQANGYTKGIGTSTSLKAWAQLQTSLKTMQLDTVSKAKPNESHYPRPPTEMREFYTTLLDNIKRMAQSLEKSASGVYEELGDIAPKYAELYEGFLDEYNESNGHDPVMPLSLMQIGIRNRNAGGDREDQYASTSVMLPFYQSKSTEHKLTYGSRKLFGAVHESTDKDPNFEQLVGVKNIVDNYNGISSADTRMDEASFEKSTGAHAMLMRYVIDTRNTRRCYQHRYAVAKGYVDLGDTALVSNLPKTVWKNEYRPHSMQNNMSRVVSLVESSDTDASVKEINKSLNIEIQDIDRRSQARLYNLIDMNIVPINVHALMRDVPLVQLINYSYTFDRMVQEYLCPDLCDLIDEKATTSTSTTSALMNKLVQYPYAELDDTEYNSLLHRIMTGDSALGAGRPKYLSDQIYNKVLLRSVYSYPQINSPDNYRPDEAGPRVSSAQSRYTNNPGGNYNNMNNDENNTGKLKYASSSPQSNTERYAETNWRTGKLDPMQSNPNKVNTPGITEVDLESNEHGFNKLSKDRFDTYLVRNMTWLTNIQRLTRRMMRSELSHIQSAVIQGSDHDSGMNYVSSHMTDLKGNNSTEEHSNMFKARY
jgi:hypothetical protein